MPNVLGTVLSYQSNFYTVASGEAVFQCFLKGNLKKAGLSVLVGDVVALDSVDSSNATARIIALEPRNSELSRPKIANVQRVLVVASLVNPALDFTQIDRYITLAKLSGLDVTLCLSKADLAAALMTEAICQSLIQKAVSTYSPLQIGVYATSIHHLDSIYSILKDVQGQRTVLAGLSGVGKSSLLNALCPQLQLMVGDVSHKIQRGQHTTRHVQLIDVGNDTLIADTPGFSYLKFDSVLPENIEAVFDDFQPYRQQCRFANCLHSPEMQGCAVQPVLSQIAPSRWESYMQFVQEATEAQSEGALRSQKQEYGTKNVSLGKHVHAQRIKLKTKQRESSRRVHHQQAQAWHLEDDTLDKE